MQRSVLVVALLFALACGRVTQNPIETSQGGSDVDSPPTNTPGEAGGRPAGNPPIHSGTGGAAGAGGSKPMAGGRHGGASESDGTAGEAPTLCTDPGLVSKPCQGPGGAPCEALCALSGDPSAIEEVLVPWNPTMLAHGSLGDANPNSLWVSADSVQQLMLFNVVDHTNETFAINEFPSFLSPSKDGSVWFTAYVNSTNVIGHFLPDLLKEASKGIGQLARAITAAPDGRHWVCQGTEVHALDETGATVQSIALDASSDCNHLHFAGDGSLWAVDVGAPPTLWQLLPGDPQRHPLEPSLVLGRMASTADALWLVASDVNAGPYTGRILRFSRAGSIQKAYQLPFASSNPWAIVLGPDGNLWFTDRYASTVNRLTPQGELTAFVVAPSPTPNDIIAGPDGKLWFTEQTGSKLGAITP